MLRITYRLNGVERTAENLDEYGIMLAKELAKSIEKWKPADGIVRLAEQLTLMRFCDPAVTVDMTKLPSATFDKRLVHLIQKADEAGFGLSNDGQIVEIRELSESVDKAEKLGMKFVPV